MCGENIKTHPGTAAVLSFLFNGLGQIYNGQLKKGLLIIFLSSVSMLVFLLGSILIGFWLFGRVFFAYELVMGLTLFFIGLICIAILSLYSIFDAYAVSLKK